MIDVDVDVMWMINLEIHMINVVIWYMDKNKEDVGNEMKFKEIKYVMKWDVRW